jgi:hypothetical protein
MTNAKFYFGNRVPGRVWVWVCGSCCIGNPIELSALSRIDCSDIAQAKREKERRREEKRERESERDGKEMRREEKEMRRERER